jgi:hypothetical protein
VRAVPRRLDARDQEEVSPAVWADASVCRLARVGVVGPKRAK